MLAPFHQIDVFARAPYRGNAVAVLHVARAPSAAAMQRLARWTQLSETVFLLPPPPGSAAHFAVRIWMPDGELPFAGHPTLGATRAWLERHPEFSGDELRMHCGIGTVRLRIERHAGQQDMLLFFAAPPLRHAAVVEPHIVAQLCAAMHIDTAHVVEAQHIDNGPPWLALRLASPAAVRAVATRHMHHAGALMWGVFAALSEQGEAEQTLLVRTFAPASGVVEDAVTGSFAAGLARSSMAPKQGNFVVRQGEQLGREGRIVVRSIEGQSWIGGCTSVCFKGEALVEDEEEEE
jgi:PhzF family phenazine biosynthesis protein